jgi:ribosomal protein S2
MEPSTLGIVLAVVGAFGTLALGINGYFLRGIFSDLNQVRIDLATVISDSNAKTERITKLEHSELELYRRLNKLEIKLEGIR